MVEDGAMVLGKNSFDFVSLSERSFDCSELDTIDVEFMPLFVGDDRFDLFAHIGTFANIDCVLVGKQNVNAWEFQMPRVFA